MTNELEFSKISSENGNEAENGAPRSKLPYPKAVFFVIATELSERFSYYGMRAVLTIYMKTMLSFTEDQATTIYHTFLLLCYGLPVLWGIIADSYLGKFTTIWIVSIFFTAGNIILTLSSVPLFHPYAVPLTIIGLVGMGVGTGGMKPCVAPFGGEQFVLPQQTKYLQQFFSVFFFAVTVGNMISTVTTPVFRSDVKCFGMDSCFPLAFGLPAIIMAIAVFVFVSGKRLYKITKPEGNMLVKVAKCIYHALSKKRAPGVKKTHWLDNADDEFDLGLITDIKMLLRVLLYYIPIPMFFALYEQLGSRWTLQATRMDGHFFGSFSIKPDQMQVCNAIFMFIFIPVFQAVIYPLFGKCRLLKRPLQRMGVGGFLAAASFCVAGIVEMKIEGREYKAPSQSETHLNFINTLNCPVLLHANTASEELDLESSHIIKLLNVKEFNVTLTLKDSCNYGIQNRKWVGTVLCRAGELQSVFIFMKNGTLTASILGVTEDFTNSNEGNAKIRFVVNGTPLNETNGLLTLTSNKAKYDLALKVLDGFSFTDSAEISPGRYSISGDLNNPALTFAANSTEGDIGTIEVRSGGSYLFVVHPSLESFNILNIVISKPNEVHMLWLVPQYILMAWAEILFIVSGMEFSFTQAPKSMKSVLQSVWHLMNAFGNLIVIVSASFQVDSQATEFFGFSGAMLLDTILFCLLAMRYTYTDGMDSDQNDNTEKL